MGFPYKFTMFLINWSFVSIVIAFYCDAWISANVLESSTSVKYGFSGYIIEGSNKEVLYPDCTWESSRLCAPATEAGEWSFYTIGAGAMVSMCLLAAALLVKTNHIKKIYWFFTFWGLFLILVANGMVYNLWAYAPIEGLVKNPNLPNNPISLLVFITMFYI